MGRNAKAEAEKALTGAGRRPATRGGASAFAPKPKRAQPPSWLAGTSARAQWKRIVPELQRLNLYNESLRDTVGRYCQHFAEWIRLTREIGRDGSTVLVVMTNGQDSMRRINPAIRVRDVTERALIDLEDRFGFSPLARYRLTSLQAAQPRGDLFGHAAGKPASTHTTPDAPPADALTVSPLPAGSPIGALRH